MIKRMHQNSLLVVFLPLRIKIESLRYTDWAHSLNYVGCTYTRASQVAQW